MSDYIIFVPTTPALGVKILDTVEEIESLKESYREDPEMFPQFPPGLLVEVAGESVIAKNRLDAGQQRVLFGVGWYLVSSTNNMMFLTNNERIMLGDISFIPDVLLRPNSAERAQTVARPFSV